MSFKQKPILMKTLVQLQFQVMSVDEFQTKVNSHADICWLSVWSYVFYEFKTKSNSYEYTCWVSVWSSVSFWLSNKSEFLWTNLLSLNLKLSEFTSFKQRRILMKTFVESQFEVMYVYEFQTKPNSWEDICWVSVWSYLRLHVSTKT